MELSRQQILDLIDMEITRHEKALKKLQKQNEEGYGFECLERQTEGKWVALVQLKKLIKQMESENRVDRFLWFQNNKFLRRIIYEHKRTSFNKS